MKSSGILWTDPYNTKNSYIRFLNWVNSLRAIFCHNCSPELRLNQKIIEDNENVLKDIFNCDLSVDELQEYHWKEMLQELVNQAVNLENILSRNLDRIKTSNDNERRQNSITSWIISISDAYWRNPEYCLQSMTMLYELYRINGGDTSAINPHSSLRNQTIAWLKEYCDAENNCWYSKWRGEKIRKEAPSGHPIYDLILDWPRRWSLEFGCSEDECDEPPLPGSRFFILLAEDVYSFASEPQNGYHLVL